MSTGGEDDGGSVVVGDLTTAQRYARDMSRLLGLGVPRRAAASQSPLPRPLRLPRGSRLLMRDLEVTSSAGGSGSANPHPGPPVDFFLLPDRVRLGARWGLSTLGSPSLTATYRLGFALAPTPLH